MSAGPSDSVHRQVTLDGLRGMAALFVVAYHGLSPFGLTAWGAAHAQLAVDFFFALSGFVLATTYRPRLGAGLSAASFLLRRWIRLAPLALAGLAFGWLVQGARGLAVHGQRLDADGRSAVFNALLLPDLTRWAAGCVTLPVPCETASDSRTW